MNKAILFFAAVFFSLTSVFAQAPPSRMLFIIDSIPLLTDPEDWNQITNDDIADISFIQNRDSLKLLGWQQIDGITYIFTKEYRNRPDSLKKIPSLKQMIAKKGQWYLHDTIYTGRYIDYYNSGRKQNEGTLVNGKLDGKLTVYFKNGNIKSVSDYRDGVLDGEMSEYYKNGALMLTRGFTAGRTNGLWKSYYINGRPGNERKFKKDTGYDTVIHYHSTGKISHISLIKNGQLVLSKDEENMNYYNGRFFHSFYAGDIKTANKHLYQIWLIDSAGLQTYLKEGLLSAKELHFDEAIAAFDRVLAIEPLERDALLQRGLARIKKYKYKQINAFSKDNKDLPLLVEDLMLVPDDDQAKICSDLQLADDLDPSDYYVKKQATEAILNFCRKKNSR